jgi:hypothetical protein
MALNERGNYVLCPMQRNVPTRPTNDPFFLSSTAVWDVDQHADVELLLRCTLLPLSEQNEFLGFNE